MVEVGAVHRDPGVAGWHVEGEDLPEVAPVVPSCGVVVVIVTGAVQQPRQDPVWQRLADDPVPWEALEQGWVLLPGRAPHGVPEFGIAEAERKVDGKVVVEVRPRPVARS